MFSTSDEMSSDAADRAERLRARAESVGEAPPPRKPARLRPALPTTGLGPRKADAVVLDAQLEDAIFDLARRRGVAPQDMPKMKKLQQLTREYQHLAPDTDCALAALKSQPLPAMNGLSAANSQAAREAAMEIDSHLTPEQVAERHAQQAKVIPYQVAGFEELLSSTPEIKFYTQQASEPATQEQLEQSLREGRLVMPHLRASFERQLLAQAGRWPVLDAKGRATATSREFPACALGELCVGRTVKFRHLPPGGVVFTSLMFPEEYEMLLETGVSLTAARPCVLCCRKLLAEWVLACRAKAMEHDVGAAKPREDAPWQMQQTRVRQFFYNSVDVEDGYKERYVLQPSANEPLVHPLVMLSRDVIFARQCATGRWLIDQTAIEWAPPPDLRPGMGETHEDF